MLRTNWKVYRKTLTLPNTEYSQALTTSSKYISAKCTDRSEGFCLSLVKDQVPNEGGTQYVTVFAGTMWEAKGDIRGEKTIYLSSPTAGIEIEIEEWS